MHDIVIAIIFVAMVLAPCITAARSGAAEAEENLPEINQRITHLVCGEQDRSPNLDAVFGV